MAYLKEKIKEQLLKAAEVKPTIIDNVIFLIDRL